MKTHNILLTGVIAILFTLVACDKENDPHASDDLGIPQLFAPPADAPAEIKKIYEDYGVWVRMDFTDPKEVTNAYLAQDASNRYGATMIDDEYRKSAIIYTQTFLSNVSKEYAKAFFPLELFYVKTYNGSFWKANYQRIGRSRFVLCWPNEIDNALPPTESEEYYYQDAAVASVLWGNIGVMIADRFEQPIKEFELAGKAYDKGEAVDNIKSQYEKDEDEEKYNAALKELCDEGGFISPSGAGYFNSDFSDWLRLLAMESYDNIKARYLDNSPKHAAKYEIIVKHFNAYGWDIQAAGNKYRQKYDAFLASQPPPEPTPTPGPEL